jgi:decaprenyl-phosphate phosphoribosyltransferase
MPSGPTVDPANSPATKGTQEKATPVTASLITRIRAHIAIARVDHWMKNIFILPGLLIPIAADPTVLTGSFLTNLLVGVVAVCLIASSNYVINEVLDAPLDRLHPTKRSRPAAAGLVNIPLAYVEWIALMLTGLALAATISAHFLYVLAALWGMGCIYNIPPARSKDVPYLDVLSEAVNNPLRMLAGWYIVTNTLIPPISLLLSYWMVGCYFMALKRFSEYRDISHKGTAAAYRKSFQFYTERSLLTSITFYASASMLFFGAFLIRYRIELVLTFPLIAWVMAIYYNLAFEKDSPVQNPERLYRQKTLMLAVVLCSAAMIGLLFLDFSSLANLFQPTLPIGLKGGR